MECRLNKVRDWGGKLRRFLIFIIPILGLDRCIGMTIINLVMMNRENLLGQGG